MPKRAAMPGLAMRALIVSSFLLIAPSLIAEELKWAIAPYMWAAGINSHTQVRGYDAVDSNAEFRDIIDKTQFAFMAYGEVRGARSGGFFDLTYLDVGTTETSSDQRLKVDAGLKTTIVDAVGFYRPGGGDEGFDLLLGTRILDMSQRIDFAFATPAGKTSSVDGSKTFVNAIGGVRYSKALSPNWNVTARADAGAGGAKLTWNAVATAGYWFGAKHSTSLQFGWKYTYVDVKADDGAAQVETTIRMNGPLAGILFRF